MSGVLLAKTMGQTGELTERFRDESRRLADLELRQRMAGRWVMAHDPGDVRDHARADVRHRRLPAGAAAAPSISIGTLVAFTTLQTRLLLPDRLAAQRAGRRADLARAVRPRVRVPRPAGRDRRAARRRSPLDRGPGAPARSSSTTSASRYDETGASRPCRTSSFVAEPGQPAWRSSARPAAGKTTLGYLIARLYDVDRGRVPIDGVDVRDLSFDVAARHVGVVSQETYLFHGTVRDNLRVRASRTRPTRSSRQAARAAQIHDHLASLPEGYDTVVGERGYRFSGGEKQRLAIARAMLRDPPVLVLDEATSALDVETERAVQEALDAARRGAHDHRHRPPALDHPRRRPDPGARRRPHRRARHPRRAGRAGRPLRRAGRARRRRRLPRLPPIQTLDPTSGSYRTADPYRDLDVIDARAPRANQTVVGLVALAGVITGEWWLLALVAAAAGAGPDDGTPLVPGLRRLLRAAAAALRRGPARGLAAAAVREPDGRGRADRRPRWPTWPGFALLGAVLGLLVAALALLSAATGFCTGCQIYKLAARVRGLGRGHGHIERIEPSDFGDALVPNTVVAVHAPALLRLPPAGARAARRGPHRGHGRRAQPAPAGPQVRRGRRAHGRDRRRAAPSWRV